MPKRRSQKSKKRQTKELRQPDYRRLERVYGITEADYKKLLKSQKGVCFICHRDPRAFTTRKYRHNLCVDHNHSNGTIRGLLCRHCNSQISRWLHDDVDKIKRVLQYFTRKPPKVSYHKLKDGKPVEDEKDKPESC